MAVAAQERGDKMLACVLVKSAIQKTLGDSLNSRQQKVLHRLFSAEPDGFAGGLSAKNHRTITGAAEITAARDLAERTEMVHGVYLAEVIVPISLGRARMYTNVKDDNDMTLAIARLNCTPPPPPPPARELNWQQRWLLIPAVVSLLGLAFLTPPAHAQAEVWLREKSGATEFDGDVTVSLACGQSTWVSLKTSNVGGPQFVPSYIQVPWSLDEPDEILVTLSSSHDDVSFLDSARNVSGSRFNGSTTGTGTDAEPVYKPYSKYVAQRGWASEITVRRWDGFWGDQGRKVLWVNPPSAWSPQQLQQAGLTNCANRPGVGNRCDWQVRVGTDGDYFNVRRQCNATPNTPVDVTITATIVGHTYGDQTNVFGHTANSAPYVPDPVIVPELIAVGVGVPNNEPDQDTSTSPDPNPHADLIAKVRGYAAETENGQAHVDRWLQVLAAFGDDNGQMPMTAAEAQTYVDRGWSRWEPVAAALTQLEAAQTNEPQPEPEPPACVSPELRSNVEDYHAETWQGEMHVTRWLRVLQTFAGTASGDTVMPSAEAQTYADKGWTRWDPVAEALKCLEARMSGTEAHVPLMASASNPLRQGLVRFANVSPQAGQVQIVAVDDTGRRSDPLTLGLGVGESVSLNSHDFERGNPRKGLGGAAGPGMGDWQLEVSSELDIDVRPYAVAPTGLIEIAQPERR